MASPRLSESALWQVIHTLEEKELRQIRARIRGTRLEKLLQKLLRMKAYSEEQLKAYILRAYPGINPNILKVYKRQLWEIIEDTLCTRDSPIIGEEVRLWSKLWMSVILWERGLSEPAETLWHQAMYSALEMGWYEVALWGVALLNIYASEFHKLAPDMNIEGWFSALLQNITQKYLSIHDHLLALEGYYPARAPDGWKLPLPARESVWSRYLYHFNSLLQEMVQNNYLKCVENAVCMMEILLAGSIDFPRRYIIHKLSATMYNLAGLLISLRAHGVYLQVYETWQKLWQKSSFPQEGKLADKHIQWLILHMAYLHQVQDWSASYAVWETHKSLFFGYLERASVSVAHRVFTGCLVFASMIFFGQPVTEKVLWRHKVSMLAREQRFMTHPYFWWLFLSWYEAYERRDFQRSRYWYWRLRKRWHQYYVKIPNYAHWIPILRLLWSLNYAAPTAQRKRAANLLRYWQANPKEYELWEADRIFFPMHRFVMSIAQGLSLHRTSPDPVQPMPIPAEQAQAIQSVLTRILVSNSF